ncbi:MAG TPA: CopG family transcriptional regulator [Gammaproteobacteria bacterium]
MSRKTHYTDEPMNAGKRVKDFLPPPDELVFKEDSVKVTITLSKSSVEFFKREASKHKTPYQKMIRNLLDAYTEAHRK